MPSEKLDDFLEELNDELTSDEPDSDEPISDEQKEQEVDQAWEEKEDPERQRAEEDGWKPQNEYEGEKTWIDFEEFNERGDIIKEGQNRSSEINKMQKRLDTQNKEHSELRDSLNEIKRNQLISLEGEIQEAIKEADSDRVNTLRQKQTKLVNQIQMNQPAPAKEVDTSSIDTWRQEHPWVKDTENPMSHFAAAKMEEYIRNNTNSPDEVTTEIIEDAVRYMDTAVSKQTMEKPNPNRKKAATTARGKTGRKGGGKPSMGNLTSEEEKLWVHMQDWPGVSEKTFLEDVQELREESKNG